jgi:hypothetical protein
VRKKEKVIRNQDTEPISINLFSLPFPDEEECEAVRERRNTEGKLSCARSSVTLHTILIHLLAWKIVLVGISKWGGVVCQLCKWSIVL